MKKSERRGQKTAENKETRKLSKLVRRGSKKIRGGDRRACHLLRVLAMVKAARAAKGKAESSVARVRCRDRLKVVRAMGQDPAEKVYHL